MRGLQFRGWTLSVHPETYTPSDDTYMLIDNMRINRGDSVLDMGTGCGILALVASESAGKVVAVDANPHAVRCAVHNVNRNRADGKVEVRLGNLFGALKQGEKFDLIVFNPPYLPAEKPVEDSSWLERAWHGGKGGREVIDRFIEKAENHMKENGRILMVQSSLSGIERTVEALRNKGFKTRILSRKRCFFEELYVIEAEESKLGKSGCSITPLRCCILLIDVWLRRFNDCTDGEKD